MRVLVFGTFDVLHPGHIYFLQQASKLGLVSVVLTPDSLVSHYKKIDAHHTFKQRRRRLGELKLVTEVYPSDLESGSFKIMTRIRPSIVLLGHDQKSLQDALKKWLLRQDFKIMVKTAQAYRHGLYKSSRLR